MGRCVAVQRIAGVGTSNENRLLLFMSDRRIVSARLEKSCKPEDFYSGFYVERNVKELQRLCFRYESFPEQAMSARDAVEAMVSGDVDYVPMSEVGDRIAATLALIYPPGIGIVIPGERYDKAAKPMVDYFLAFEESCNRFPGFSYEVQGVYQVTEAGRIRFYTYVVKQ